MVPETRRDSGMLMIECYDDCLRSNDDDINERKKFDL